MASTWKKTTVGCLVKHSVYGTYYARARINGKLRWRALETSDFATAKVKILSVLQDLHAETPSATGLITFADAINLHLSHVAQDASTKPRTKLYAQERANGLRKSWYGLWQTKLIKISEEDCRTWAGRFSKQFSPTTFNNTLSILREAFKLAVSAGAIRRNPTEGINRATVHAKREQIGVTLPTREQMVGVLRAMRCSVQTHSREAYHLASFLTYSGFRLDEARAAVWADVDWQWGGIGAIWARKTKNGRPRLVPMAPALRKLLEEMRADGDNGPIIRVGTCRHSLSNACRVAGAPRITHHDLRKVFITQCLEQGIPAATVAAWVGHQDGGRLVLSTYGHLRDDHSAQMAAKLQF